MTEEDAYEVLCGIFRELIGATEIWCSDKSTLGDFDRYNGDSLDSIADEVSSRIGFKVTDDDLISSICERMAGSK